MRINGTLMRVLRSERGIGPTHAAAIAGISRPVLLRIESNDTNAARMLTVDGLIHLAEALGTNPAELLAHEQTNAPDQTVGSAPSPETADPRILLGLLHEHRDQTTRRALADALGWTGEQVKTAIADLNTRLDGTGLTIYQREDMLQLVATETKAVNDVATRLTINKQTRRGMNITNAKALHRVWQGQVGGGRTGKQVIIALTQLTKTGAITQVGPETYTPSEALRYALDT